MSETKYSKSSWDDIVFEGLNQDYGSYVLRKLINKNTLRAFVITTIVFLLILLIAKLQVFDRLAKKEEKIVEVALTDVNLPPPPPVEEAPPPPPPPPPPPVRPTIKMVELIAKKDELVQDEKVTKQEEVKETQISTKTIEGDKEAKASIIIPKEEGGKGPEPQPQPEKPKAPEILIRSEVMPSFPGGPAELMKYLFKNINYPSLARENGLEGKVIVNFYVDTDGSIKNPTIVKDPVGGGCAEEAIRVIKAMPKWAPGSNNGVPVKVYYTLPVSFKLQ